MKPSDVIPVLTSETMVGRYEELMASLSAEEVAAMQRKARDRKRALKEGENR